MKNVKYSYIKNDVNDVVKRCNHETRHYERYDYNQDKWVIDYIPFEDFFDYRDISEEEALEIIADRKSKFRT